MKSFLSINLLFTLLVLTTGFGAHAQTEPQKIAGARPENATGVITVIADTSITNLEKKQRYFRETRGYRIQLYLGTLEQVKVERSKYLALGLPYSAYLKQVVPEQALQIGDFISRMEMEKHLEIIKQYYPKAFGVVEFIEPPKFPASRKPR